MIRRFSANDRAVSPIIGTILMIAVTVVLGATVYGAVNGFGSKTVKESTNAAFRVQAVDTNNDGATDVLKLTYVTGPSGVAESNVVIQVKNATGAVQTLAARGAAWSPGDLMLYDLPRDTYFVSVSILGSAVVDQTVSLDA